MNRSRWLWLFTAVAGAGFGGCTVETTTCIDDDIDGICDDVDPCVDLGAGCACVDNDLDTICDDVDDCIDVDQNGECDGVGCIDSDLDGVCDDEDCYPNDSYWTCDVCTDADGDFVCDPEVGDIDFDGIPDDEDCYDNILHQFLCEDFKECQELTDNVCTDPWYLVYCADGGGGNQFWGSDCNAACQTDPAVYEQAGCDGPAVSGQCDDSGDAICLCYCQDSFDSCLNEYIVQYTRDGTTYQEDCKTYCTAIGGNGGSCDATAGACFCD